MVDTPVSTQNRVYFILVRIPCNCMRLVCRNKRNHPAHELVKIGFSRDITKRMKSFRCSNPFETKLLATVDGGRAIEAALHRIYRRDRVTGEWFEYSQDMRDDLQRGAIYHKGNYLVFRKEQQQ